MIRLEIKKLQFDINRKAAKYQLYHLTKLMSKIDKYEYLTGKEILPYNQHQIIEQAKFTYSPLRKAFEKQIQTIEDKGETQIKDLEDLKPKAQAKAFVGKSYNKLSIQKEIYDELLDERVDEYEK